MAVGDMFAGISDALGAGSFCAIVPTSGYEVMLLGVASDGYNAGTPPRPYLGVFYITSTQSCLIFGESFNSEYYFRCKIPFSNSQYISLKNTDANAHDVCWWGIIIKEP